MFEFKLPDLGEGIHEGELLLWHVAEGDHVTEDDPLCDMETDKAAVTIPSPSTGQIHSLNAQPGQTIEVGSVFVVIDDGKARDNGIPDSPVDSSVEPEIVESKTAESRPGKSQVIAAPATRRQAREMDIDIRQVQGSGPGGRVTPEDLTAFENQTLSPAGERDADKPPHAAHIQAGPIPFFEIPVLPEPDGPVERIPMRSLRKKVAVKTTSASIMMPHVAHMDEVDVTDLEALRQEFNAGHEGKLTLLAFVIKAVAAQLKAYPMFNASVDAARQEMVYKKFYHLGFAADTPRGLMVPVIQDADRLSLTGLGYRIRHLAQKAREGSITVPELTGSTFTITNVGAIGGTHVFPIINAPESAIIGLGRVEKKPVVRPVDGEDKIVIRTILPVTLCFDHRVGDGAQAAAFVRDIKAMLEDTLEFMAGI